MGATSLFQKREMDETVSVPLSYFLFFASVPRAYITSAAEVPPRVRYSFPGKRLCRARESGEVVSTVPPTQPCQ